MTAGNNQRDEKADIIVKKEDGKDNVALLEARADASAVDASKVSFLTSVDEEARIKLALDRGVFIGFTKDELMRFEKDPGWKRLRLVLLILFWVAWALLLLAAIVVIVFTPPCPGRPALQWPEKFPIYQIHVPSYRVGNRCVTQVTGNVEGVFEVLNSPKDNYFERIQPADILWLRGLHKNPVDTELDKDIDTYLPKLFESAKKKQRRVLLDLLPYKQSSTSSKLTDLKCGILSNSALRLNEDSTNAACIDNEEDVNKLIAFVHKYRNYANGFVLDYNQWILNASSSTGKSLLEKLVEAVTRGAGGDAGSGDNAKHLFMRFPVLDKRYVNLDNKALIETRVQEEEAARKAGIRVIIETIAMRESDSSACSDIDCLSQLVNVIQSFSNRSAVYRAFAVDDMLFKGRTYTVGSKTWKSPEALAAFAITALPGTPIIYYGSEIGMVSDTNATGVMQWSDIRNNTCSDTSAMCFCGTSCVQQGSTTNRTCPIEFPLVHHEASVREQIRDESTGPLKSFVQLMLARQNNDSLSWGKSHLSIDQTTPKTQRILVAMRQAEQFERFALFISYSSPTDKESVPHSLQDDVASSCYQTVYSFSNGLVSSSEQKQKFSDMVLKNDEVRLVRIFKTCGAASIRAMLPLYMLVAIVTLLFSRRH